VIASTGVSAPRALAVAGKPGKRRLSRPPPWFSGSWTGSVAGRRCRIGTTTDGQTDNATGSVIMAKDHGPSVKDDKQYEGLRKKGMSKSRAAAIANKPGASKKGGKKSG
jgi:hypothetical protein